MRGAKWTSLPGIYPAPLGLSLFFRNRHDLGMTLRQALEADSRLPTYWSIIAEYVCDVTATAETFNKLPWLLYCHPLLSHSRVFWRRVICKRITRKQWVNKRPICVRWHQNPITKSFVISPFTWFQGINSIMIIHYLHR